jgi:ubiquinone/menaquinone biosynthesis C-methylase UbiE/uncharacterized protein YbaR (Trm112 family)
MESALPAAVVSVVACPLCKGELHGANDSLLCRTCSQEYPIVSGIPSLLPPNDARTIDPSALRIKSKEGAARTILGMTRQDSGFLRAPRVFYALYLALAASLVARWPWVVTGLLLVLAADWLCFVFRRRKTLRRDLANPLRLRTAADHGEIDALYRRHGKRQPGMSDWVALARESAGGSSAPAQETARGSSTASQTRDRACHTDDERYRDILRVYSERARPTDVVLDVGANDGRAYARFGIGKGAAFIGIDVSRTLLEKFRENVPDQTAIQADGGVLPIRDESVDFLFCTETLEHLADPQAASAEFIRVLKPGGRLMVQSPNAHRLRNLNLFHIVALLAGLFTDRVLQKKIVHENTWHNAVTHHWDFSKRDYRRMFDRRGCLVTALYSRSFFFPGFLLRGRIGCFGRKERLLSSIPGVRFFGDDLVVVAEKLG